MKTKQIQTRYADQKSAAGIRLFVADAAAVYCIGFYLTFCNNYIV